MAGPLPADPPLLAVLQENLPWLKQWHSEVDPEYNQRFGNFFEACLYSQLSTLGLTEAVLVRSHRQGPAAGKCRQGNR